MSLADFIHLEPYLWLGIGGLMVLLLGLLPGGKTWAYMGTVVVLVATIISSAVLLHEDKAIENFVYINVFTQSCIIFFNVIALAVVFMSRSSSPIKETIDEVYYSLILFSVLGMAFTISNNLIAVLIGIEMTTICAFCLVAWNPSRPGSVEAATKFVITAGLATGFLLMGIAIIYLGSGTVIISGIDKGANNINGAVVLVRTGLLLVLVGVFFELAVAPFHCWLADVYEGAPAPIVAFIGSIAKLAIVAWLILLPQWLSVKLWFIVETAIAGAAVISMLTGAILALRQMSLKRILAYSSITHFGFILVAFAVYQALSIPAIIYYAVGYGATTIAALAIIIRLEKAEGLSHINHYRGLAFHSPAMGIALTLVILSLAGFPPLTGFFAKFLIFQTAINHHSWLLVIVMALSNAIGLFYYLRILLAIFDQDSINNIVSTARTNRQTMITINNLVIMVFVILTVVIGIAVQPVVQYAISMFHY